MISLTLLILGILCLWMDRRLNPPRPAGTPTPTGAPAPAGGQGSARSSPFSLLSTGSGLSHYSVTRATLLSTQSEDEPEATDENPVPYRLANTRYSVDHLARLDTAILLENALIDSAVRPLPVIPEHLAAGETPGGYLVQSTRPLDRRFYDALADRGAEFVAYVPNNTALVKASPEVASTLERMPGVRTVLPYAPYYKLATDLLPLAVEQEPLEPDQVLKVLLYPGTESVAAQALSDLGAEPVAETRSPFGPMLAVRAPVDSLTPLARLAEVQRIEILRPRILLNDLARTRVNVSTNSTTNTSYLGLSGKDILVNVNDTGVDATHPALTGRVSSTDTNSFTLVDPNGHGTHVAGTLAGDGAESESVSNVLGSLPGAWFSGMATQAQIYALPIDLITGPLVSDVYLQEEAAKEYYLRRRGTNVLVSNNSWNYSSSFLYDLEAASYDAATRDALPDVPGTQPLLFVFAAGNSGLGTDQGIGQRGNRIGSPATAKNVLSVGALEQIRDLTNVYYVTNNPTGTNEVVTTNTPFLSLTDSEDQVAAYSSRGNVGINREGTFGRFKPDLVAPGTFLVSARSAAWTPPTVATNDPLYGEYEVLKELDEGLEPDYRYETGTSMAAPVVSGMLALLQEFFEERLHQPASPALLKALLLHGTRPVNAIYDLATRATLNSQGWGLPNLTNSIPEILETAPEEEWPIRFYADSTTNVLATGQAHTWTVQVSSNAQYVPFRATLVWTDPPGNPGASIKLVNDLDLIITNLNTDEVFYGNYFSQGSDYTSPRETNTPPTIDFVNNVENIVLPPLQTAAASNSLRLSITVSARRVNVNALTANTNDVVQDYALVFSAGDGIITNQPIEEVTWEGQTLEVLVPQVLTNGVAQVKQHAGANFQLITGTNGVTNQWAFYVFTNTFYTNQNVSGLTNGSNVAFITFLPPNLSRARNYQSDIDLYVSRDPALLDLNPFAVNTSLKSLRRGGTEVIALTNAILDEVFYVGVKAEDQQSSEFGLVVQSSDLQFSDTDEFGNKRISVRDVPIAVPDGEPANPGGVLLLATTPDPPIDVSRVMVDFGVTHQSIGDLVGILSHEDSYVALQNHNRQVDDTTNQVWQLQYEDNPSGNFPGSQYSDGPGSLNSFVGHSSDGVWMFTVTDDSKGRTGWVEQLSVRLTPNPEGDEFVATILPNEWFYFFRDLPPAAVRFTVALSAITPTVPLDVYIRRDQLPDFDNYDKYGRIPGNGGAVSLSRSDSPPLNPGRYFVGIYNPNDVVVTATVTITIEIDLNAVNRGGAEGDDVPKGIQDDAITRSTIFVPESRPVSDVSVGLRVDHPRASDLVFHLISPQGTRVLLAENRGGTSPQGYGATILKTNVASRASSGGPEEDRQLIDTGVKEGTVRVDYDFFNVPDQMKVLYDGVAIYDTGLTNGARSFAVNFGPGVATNIVIVVNEGGSPEPTTLWNYTAEVVTQREAYAVLTDQTNLTTLPIKFAQPPFTNSPGSQFGTNRQVFLDSFEDYDPGTYDAPAPLGLWQVTEGTVVVETNVGGVTAYDQTNFVRLVPGATPAALGVDIGTTRGGRYSATVAVHQNPLVPDGIPQALGLYVDGILSRWVPVGTNVGTNDWELASVVWEAGGTLSRFEIRTTTTGGPLIDAVVLNEILEGGEAYFLPEEELVRPLKAELPYGTWTLEVLDDRVGPGTTNTPTLINWTLNFIFAVTNKPVTELKPCRYGDTVFGIFDADCNQRTNVVMGDDLLYFAVQAPLSAGSVTNLALTVPELFSGSGTLRLLYNATGLPDGNQPGDVVIDTGNTNGSSLVLRTNTLPPLIPGQRYYLGVGNSLPDETNAFLITAEFDRVDGSLVNPPTIDSGLTVTNTIAPTNVVQYYQWDLTGMGVPTYATFDLRPQDGNVDLYVRRALPIPDPLPRPNPSEHDYASTNAGTVPDLIMVTPLSQPMPLQDGIWYIGVLTRSTSNVTYTLTVDRRDDLLPLGNGIPVGGTLAGTNDVRHFQFLVSDYATNVNVQVASTNADAEVYISRVIPGPLPFPSPTNYAYAATNVVGPGTETVSFSPNSVPPLLPGVYYFTVQTPDPGPADFVITVREEGDFPPNEILLVDGVPQDITIPAGTPTPPYFYFPIVTPTPAALFEVYNLDQPADLLLEYNQYPVRGSPFRSSSGDPALPPQIVLRTSDPATPVLLGDWFLEMVPSLAQDLHFTIRAVTSTNGILPSFAGFNTQLSMVGTDVALTWDTVDGERYEIARSTDLVSWTVLTTITANGRSESYTDTTWAGGAMVYYRIRQVP